MDIDKRKQEILDLYYDEIEKKSSMIAEKQFRDIEEEFKIVADGLSIEEQLTYWRDIKNKMVSEAKDPNNKMLKAISKENIFKYSRRLKIVKKTGRQRVNLGIFDLLDIDNHPDQERSDFIFRISNHFAKVDVIKRTKERIELLLENKKYQIEPLEWTDNPNTLMQIVYGLIAAKKINNGKGEIKKIISSFAALFDNIGEKYLRSNHSKNIHCSNSNYIPAIFDEMKEAYLGYRNQKIEEKKRRK